MDDINEPFHDAPRPLGRSDSVRIQRFTIHPVTVPVPDFHGAARGWQLRLPLREHASPVQLVLDALGYADDLILAAGDTIQLQEQITKVEAFCTWSGIALAPSKCYASGILHGTAGQAHGLERAGATPAAHHDQLETGGPHQTR